MRSRLSLRARVLRSASGAGVSPFCSKRDRIKLSIALTQNGKQVSEIAPYLGAYGHLIILNHGNPNDFIHAHPLTETKPTNGTVDFIANFPTIGTYTLYGQFNLANKIITLPITVSVSDTGSLPPEGSMQDMDHMSQ